jgi:predicted nucleotidyltransferase
MRYSQKRTIIEAISSHLITQRKDISIAYLFGSFISAEFFSDIDLGVVTQMELDRPLDFEVELENELEKVTEYPVDLRALNRARFSFCQDGFGTEK